MIKNLINYLCQNKSGFLSASVWLMLSNYLLQFTLHSIMSRQFSMEIYGDFSLILRSMQFSVPIVLLGLHVSVERFLPIYISTGRYQTLIDYLRWNRRVMLRSFALTMLFGVFLIYASIILDRMQIIVLDSWHPLIYSIVLIPFAALIRYSQGISISLKMMWIYYLPEIVLTILIILFSLLIFRYVYPIKLIYIIEVIGITNIIVMCMQMLIFYFMWPKSTWLNVPNNQFVDSTWLTKSLQMMVVTVITQGLGAIDLFLLEMLSTDEVVVGHFSIILTIVNIVYTLSAFFQKNLSPNISVMLVENRHDELQALVNKLSVNKTICAFFYLGTTVLGGKFILGLFGSDAIVLYEPLCLMSIGMTFYFLMGFSNVLLMMSDGVAWVSRCKLAELLLIAVLDVIFIPRLGMKGVVIAFLSTIFITRSALYYSARKKTGIKPFFI